MDISFNTSHIVDGLNWDRNDWDINDSPVSKVNNLKREVKKDIDKGIEDVQKGVRSGVKSVQKGARDVGKAIDKEVKKIQNGDAKKNLDKGIVDISERSEGKGSGIFRMVPGISETRSIRKSRKFKRKIRVISSIIGYLSPQNIQYLRCGSGNSSLDAYWNRSSIFIDGLR